MISVYPGINHGHITRLEIRICDVKAKAVLNPYDLILPLEGFIEINGDKILRKFNHGILPDNAIVFDEGFIDDELPYLPYLIPYTLNRGCLSQKSVLFP